LVKTLDATQNFVAEHSLKQKKKKMKKSMGSIILGLGLKKSLFSKVEILNHVFLAQDKFG